MQQKYLALALSAIFATTALTGCGSDNDGNYVAPPTDGGTTTPPTDGGTTTPPTDGGTTTPPTDGGTTTPPGSNDPVDNPGNAANDGDQAKMPSVVGQQYIRGTVSNFDKTPSTNANAANNGNATVVGFETLQNKKMTNIVVAQFADDSNKDANGKSNLVKYILGAAPTQNPSVNDTDSLQTRNDASDLFNTNTGAFVVVGKTQTDADAPQYAVTGQESKVGNNTNVIQTGGSATIGGNDVRIFGALATTTDDTRDFNSAAYYVKDNKGNKLDLRKVGADGNDFDIQGIKLANVQYGRVTGNLDGLTAANIAGKNYVSAGFADKDFNGNTTQTDVYFYRGLNETSLADMNALQAKGGVYQYAGHALMYGIDNTYNGEQGSGNSNSVAYGASGVGVGNFVQAQFDAGNRTLAGSVYNVWDKGAEGGKLEQVDLVTFGGDVVGNSVVNGTADRTYVTGNDKAAFKGSFFGKNAEELGGSFNSITSGYGNSAWGGVFGAKQLPATEVPPTTLPPINGVE